MSKDLIAENKKLKEQITELKFQLKIEKIKNRHLEVVNATIMNQIEVSEDKKEVLRKVVEEYLEDFGIE